MAEARRWRTEQAFEFARALMYMTQGGVDTVDDMLMRMGVTATERAELRYLEERRKYQAQRGIADGY